MWRGWSLHKRAVANTASPRLSAAVRSSSRPIDPDRSPSWRPPERRWLSMGEKEEGQALDWRSNGCRRCRRPRKDPVATSIGAADERRERGLPRPGRGPSVRVRLGLCIVDREIDPSIPLLGREEVALQRERPLFQSPRSCCFPFYHSQRLAERTFRIKPGVYATSADTIVQCWLTDPTRLATELQSWEAVRGRDLPWRRRRDAYGLVMAEVLLQQTAAASVVPIWSKVARSITRDPKKISSRHLMRSCSGKSSDSGSGSSGSSDCVRR